MPKPFRRLFHGVRLFAVLPQFLLLQTLSPEGRSLGGFANAFHWICPHALLVMQSPKMNCLPPQSTSLTSNLAMLSLHLGSLHHAKPCTSLLPAIWDLQQRFSLTKPTVAASFSRRLAPCIPLSRMTNATPQDKPVWMQVSMHHHFDLRCGKPTRVTHHADCSASPANL